MKQNFYIYTLILLFLLLMQCSSTSFIENGIIVNGIKSVNPNVRIVARDKSFEITANKLTKLTDIIPNISTIVDPMHPYEHDLFKIINDFPKVYGKEVFIHIAGRSEPYYGKAVVVYEHYPRKAEDIIYSERRHRAGKFQIYGANFKAWTLWISDKPIHVKRDLR